MQDYLSTCAPAKRRKAREQSLDEVRQRVLRRLDQLDREEIAGFALERGKSGVIFIKVYPKVIVDRP